jgi:hypothetical protein
MILAKVTREFYGQSEAKHRIGEVMRVDVNDHLLKTGYLSGIEEATPILKCSCGRMFRVVPESDDPEQLLTTHIAELGDGHKAGFAEGGIVSKATIAMVRGDGAGKAPTAIKEPDKVPA